MKFLIVLCAAVAVSMAKPGYLGGGVAGFAGYAAPLGYGGHYGGHVGYAGPQALPVITPAGVPLDTPEVQAARAVHFAAHAKAAAAAALSGPGIDAYAGPGVAAYAGPGIAAYAAPGAVYGAHAGVAGLGYGGYGAYGGYHGPQALPVLTPAGVPVDTPEVQAARAADAVAHLNAKAQHVYG